jgi:hypothetical protein
VDENPCDHFVGQASKSEGVFFMNKAVLLAILVGGIVLVVYGVAASKSFSSGISRFFSGSPTDKTIWLLIGGIVAIIIGLDYCVVKLNES